MANEYLGTYRREHDKTMKVLRSFPADQPEFKPHDRSNSARQIAWTFVLGEKMMLYAAKGEQVIGNSYPKSPESWPEIIDQFEAQHRELVGALERANMNGTVKFYKGPQQVADFSTKEFLEYILFDQVHHRGQLTVYTRMAGAKVPAVYGPSADEPWS